MDALPPLDQLLQQDLEVLQNAFCGSCRSYAPLFYQNMARYQNHWEHFRNTLPDVIRLIQEASTREQVERPVMRLQVLAAFMQRFEGYADFSWELEKYDDVVKAAGARLGINKSIIDVWCAFPWSPVPDVVRWYPLQLTVTGPPSLARQVAGGGGRRERIGATSASTASPGDEQVTEEIKRIDISDEEDPLPVVRRRPSTRSSRGAATRVSKEDAERSQDKYIVISDDDEDPNPAARRSVVNRSPTPFRPTSRQSARTEQIAQLRRNYIDRLEAHMRDSSGRADESVDPPAVRRNHELIDDWCDGMDEDPAIEPRDTPGPAAYRRSSSPSSSGDRASYSPPCDRPAAFVGNTHVIRDGKWVDLRPGYINFAGNVARLRHQRHLTDSLSLLRAGSSTPRHDALITQMRSVGLQAVAARAELQDLLEEMSTLAASYDEDSVVATMKEFYFSVLHPHARNSQERAVELLSTLTDPLQHWSNGGSPPAPPDPSYRLSERPREGEMYGVPADWEVEVEVDMDWEEGRESSASETDRDDS